MTFGLLLANRDQVVLACDRRLTGGGGVLVDDSSQKVGHLLLDDASLLYCFTGLARWKDHKTATWIQETLKGAGIQSFRELLSKFPEAASKAFASNPQLCQLPPNERRLTIMMGGYVAPDSTVNVLFSNFQDFTNFIDLPEAVETFSLFCEGPREPDGTLVQAVGAFRALNVDDENDLRDFLSSSPPPHAIGQKAASFVQDLAKRLSARGTVGQKINVGRLTRAAPLAASASYFSDEVEGSVFLLDLVDLRGAGTNLMIKDLTFRVGDGAVVFPRVHRNAPCPCGSGKRYRHCHRP